MVSCYCCTSRFGLSLRSTGDFRATIFYFRSPPPDPPRGFECESDTQIVSIRRPGRVPHPDARSISAPVSSRTTSAAIFIIRNTRVRIITYRLCIVDPAPQLNVSILNEAQLCRRTFGFSSPANHRYIFLSEFRIYL